MTTTGVQPLLPRGGGRRRMVLLLGLCLTVPAAASAPPPADPQAPAPEIEAGPFVLSAAAVLPPQLVAGPHYRVRDRIDNDGFMNHYVIDTDFGILRADSTAQLRVRLTEVQALAALSEVSRAEAFIQAFERSLTAPIHTAAEVAQRPVETLKGAPGGVVRYFRRKARKIRNQAERAQEEVQEYQERRDEKEAAAGSGEAEEETAAEKAEEILEEGAAYAAKYGKRKLGYNRQRRYWAQQLGVDPYTDNEALDAELDRIAKAAAFGGFSTRFVGLPEVPGIDYLLDLDELVWRKDPLDLRLRNERLLRRHLGLATEELERLYENPFLSANAVTVLVESVVALNGVEGRRQLVDLAVVADTRPLAGFLVRTAAFLAGYHAEVAPLDRLLAGAAIPVGRTRDGVVVAPLAVDHLAWTETVAALAAERTRRVRAEGEPVTELVALLDGTLSPPARAGLERLGWRVEEGVFDRLEAVSGSPAPPVERRAAAGEPGPPVPFRPFDLFAPRWEGPSWANAYLLALASEAAYRYQVEDFPGQSYQERFQSLFAPLGLDVVTFMQGGGQKTDTQALVLAHPDFRLVVFSGSESHDTMSFVRDWVLTDAKIRPLPLGQVLVHRGFLQASEGVYEELRQLLFEGGEDPRPLWITGHSLGGALANLVAYRLAEDGLPVQGVTTFGAPKLGNVDFAAEFEARLGRRSQQWAAQRDPVPLLPELKDSAAYERVGRVNLLDAAGEVVFDGAPSASGVPNPKAHLMASYLNYLYRGLPEETRERLPPPPAQCATGTRLVGLHPDDGAPLCHARWMRRVDPEGCLERDGELVDGWCALEVPDKFRYKARGLVAEAEVEPELEPAPEPAAEPAPPPAGR